jgi:DNA-directed RNA polymerase specialized sigma24 family protein
MTAKGDVYKALDEAFRAAFLLTGITEVAENAALDGIAALEFGDVVDDVLPVETVKSAIQRADLTSQSEQAPSHLPRELRRLFLLAPLSRDCFVLRVLLGMPLATCSAVLHLAIHETEDVLCAALQELPRLEAHSSIRRDISQTAPALT